jgi:hypothetical protein
MTDVASRDAARVRTPTAPRFRGRALGALQVIRALLLAALRSSLSRARHQGSPMASHPGTSRRRWTVRTSSGSPDRKTTAGFRLRSRPEPASREPRRHGTSSSIGFKRYTARSLRPARQTRPVSTMWRSSPSKLPRAVVVVVARRPASSAADSSGRGAQDDTRARCGRHD